MFNCCRGHLILTDSFKCFYSSADGEPHFSSTDSHISNQPSHLDGSNPHIADQESHTANQESHTANQESHTANQESHTANQEQHTDSMSPHVEQLSSYLEGLPDHLTGQFPAEEKPSVLESILMFPFFRANDTIAKFFAFSLSFVKNQLPGLVIFSDVVGAPFKFLIGETVRFDVISMGGEDPHQQEGIAGGAISTDTAMKNYQRSSGVGM